MRMLERNGIVLHWREDGDPDGAPVVFANSLGTDLRLWDSIVSRMPSGLRLIRFDKRGHGLSSCPTAPYTLDALIDDTEGFLESIGIKSCLFVGLSIGGMIAQGLAARRPDLVSAAVLSNTAAQMGDRAMWQARVEAVRQNGMESIADAVMERWFSPDFLSSTEVQGWRNMLIRTPADGYVGCCSAIAGADLSAQTAALDLPVLGIAGALDGASPPDVVAATIERIKGARMEVMPGVGHLPCVEDPDEFSRVMTSFLKEIGHV